VHIIGTAGHVDHGKSLLVRALTGTDPDRWIEEKLRGMTLDLGFAHLRFDDGVEAGIVDVPGHERFLHNMLAGAAGMELLLLVVAANEGPKPQTIEHLAILSYLNVRRTIVVLTKSDLVDEDDLALAQELVRDAVRGSVAEGAPIQPVSALTGDGLEALRGTIHEALRGLPPRMPQAPAYLPIDRVFALQGHGTIVTGTLMQGELTVGDMLKLAPSARSVRVRSLQVFGEARDRVGGGARVAVNLPGIETGDVRRGDVLASPQFVPQRVFDVLFKPLNGTLQFLHRRTQVRAYIGSAEILGTLQFEALPVAPGVAVPAHLLLRGATIALPGATFVARRLSPKDLLGGGIFESAGSSGEPEVDEDPAQAGILAAVRAAGLEGANAARIGAIANVREQLAAEMLARLSEAGRVHRLAKPDAYVDADAIRQVEARVRAELEHSHAAAPWLMGMTSLGLSRALEVPEAALLRVLTLLTEDGRVASRVGYYSMVGFTPRLTEEQREFFEREVSLDPAQPFLPASLPAVVQRIKGARIAGLSQAFDALVASGAVVKVSDALYRSTQIAEVRRRLEAALHKDHQITASGFRDIVGTSRKYAVPLLEWFDATGVTMRNGDNRVLRERRPG
jgi:selenocysteine-specific elongation factor